VQEPSLSWAGPAAAESRSAGLLLLLWQPVASNVPAMARERERTMFVNFMASIQMPRHVLPMLGFVGPRYPPAIPVDAPYNSGCWRHEWLKTDVAALEWAG
jgi:hypothetical protein